MFMVRDRDVTDMWPCLTAVLAIFTFNWSISDKHNISLLGRFNLNFKKQSEKIWSFAKPGAGEVVRCDTLCNIAWEDSLQSLLMALLG